MLLLDLSCASRVCGLSAYQTYSTEATALLLWWISACPVWFPRVFRETHGFNESEPMIEAHWDISQRSPWIEEAPLKHLNRGCLH